MKVGTLMKVGALSEVGALLEVGASFMVTSTVYLFRSSIVNPNGFIRLILKRGATQFSGIPRLKEED